MSDENTVSPIEQAQDNTRELLADMSFRMFNPHLSAIRAQNPFLSIAPFPNSAVTVLLGANAAQDIHLPEGTKLINITFSGEIYISRQGNAQIPLAAQASDTGAFQPVNGAWMYVEEIRQFSIVAVSADTRVSVACYQQM